MEKCELFFERFHFVFFYDLFVTVVLYVILEVERFQILIQVPPDQID